MGPFDLPASWELPTLSYRRYAEPAKGWVDGIYQGRPCTLEPLSYPETPASHAGLLLEGNHIIEETPALEGDAQSIGRFVYHAGNLLSFAAPACNYHVEIELASCEESQAIWQIVVNNMTCTEVFLAPHKLSHVSFNVALTQKNLELMCTTEADTPHTIELVSLKIRTCAPTPSDQKNLWVVGDSIVQTYFDSERPQSGWGEWLAEALLGPGYTFEHDDGLAVVQARHFALDRRHIYNDALGARSSKSYICEGHFARVAARIQPGDTVLIQFAANDATPTRPMRYVSPKDFPAWLGRYVDAVRDRGAFPVLVTETPSYKVAMGEADPHFEAYMQAEREFAAEHGVALIDLHEAFLSYMEDVPVQNREAYYLRIAPRQWDSHPDGIQDGVHLSISGAKLAANIVCRELGTLAPDWRSVNPSHIYDIPVPDSAICRVTFDSVHMLRDIIGCEVYLRWSAPEHAHYFTIEKLNAKTGRLYSRFTSVESLFHDLPLPGQASEITYRVRCWRQGIASEPTSVTVKIANQEPSGF